ncbi:macro domain-containing protein [Actinomadura macrotermitis]|uniref:O-acetyl-ADP-ribose deacetylase n=1 Tax=Actinomadura macrotermitis TaxID=2585200 RepID=A0A7K0C736_9ACTN|nr:macro domain-containing protein [Actinomadura macrotermitis]MQY09289.1 O-acetyl-ADP-ribose deacetylase [Actinomadura macrotermitis]
MRDNHASPRVILANGGVPGGRGSTEDRSWTTLGAHDAQSRITYRPAARVGIIASMAVIEVVLGDITREQTDAIVTAANESLLGGGGVDGAIHRAAGPRLAEAGGAIGPCDPGDAMATPAFELDPPVRHVIHTVGPVWEGGGQGEAEILASCYRRCLEVADELGVSSIAFPAIATGVYGFPADEAARIAVAALGTAPTGVRLIRLVAFDEEGYEALMAAQPETGSRPAFSNDE